MYQGFFELSVSMLLLCANFMALVETHLITALTMVVVFYCCVVVGYLFYLLSTT